MRPPNETSLLVVEDEFLIAMGLEMMLQAAGYNILGPHGTVEDAMEAVAEHSPDLALLDVNLAGHRVYPVADVLSARMVPIIFLTGCGESDLPPRFAGTPVLVKPFSAEKLLHIIGRTLKDGASVSPASV